MTYAVDYKSFSAPLQTSSIGKAVAAWPGCFDVPCLLNGLRQSRQCASSFIIVHTIFKRRCTRQNMDGGSSQYPGDKFYNASGR